MNQFFKVVIEPQEEGGYTSYIPKLPGCVTEGETYNETIENIQDALKLYLGTLKERKQHIIKDDTRFIEVCVQV